MRGFWALLRLEALTELRDRSRWVPLIALLGAFFLPPWVEELRASLPDPRALWPEEVVSQHVPHVHLPPCTPEEAPAVAVRGTWPRGLPWPEPLVGEGEARALVVVEDRPESVPRLSTRRLGEGGPQDVEAVTRCLHRARAGVRRARMASLGLPWEIDDLVRVDVVRSGSDVEGPLRLPLFAVMLGFLGTTLAGGVAAEAVPRRRATGLFEQLRATPTPGIQLVAAWLVAIAGMTCVALAVFAGSYLLGAAWAGIPVAWETVLHVPGLVLVVTAASVLTSLEAADARAASMRWGYVMFSLLLLTAAAVALRGTPGWAALVPLGGQVLALGGWLGGFEGLASLAAVGWTGVLVRVGARQLQTGDGTVAGVAPALMRHARGRFLPEVGLLGAMGISAGVVAGVASLQGNLVLGIGVAFLGLLVVPSLLTPLVLQVPHPPLLPWKRPAPRDLGLMVPLLVGLLALAPTVLQVTQAVLPASPALEQLAERLGEEVGAPGVQLALVIFPAVGEELMYRGAIQGLLMQAGWRGRAVVLQAVLFAVAHGAALRLPWTLVVGCVLGVVRLRTGSLWPGMLLHALLNGTVVTVAASAGAGAAGPDAEGALQVLPLALLLGVLPWVGRTRTG